MSRITFKSDCDQWKKLSNAEIRVEISKDHKLDQFVNELRETFGILRPRYFKK